jgi:hypothetical protein
MGKVAVGVRPNGLAYASDHRLLLVAHVGDPASPAPATVALVSVDERTLIATIPFPGKTRWAVYDARTAAFYVNVADPPQIAVIEAGTPDRIARVLPMPSAGPHGLDLDSGRGRLFCACDGGQLVALDAKAGSILGSAPLSGVPDVIWFDAPRHCVYVAVGDPGVVEIFDVSDAEGSLARVGVVPSELDAKTTAFDAQRGRLYVFLPRTHRAAVYAIADGAAR